MSTIESKKQRPREIRDKEREYFKESMKLRKLDLSHTSWEQAQDIRKRQDEAWKKHLFYKHLLNNMQKDEGGKEK